MRRYLTASRAGKNSHDAFTGRGIFSTVAGSMPRPADEPRIDRDGVRVFAVRRQSGVRRWLVTAAAVIVGAAIVVAVTTHWFIARGAATSARPVIAPVQVAQHEAAPRAIRPVPKFPVAPVDQTAKPARAARTAPRPRTGAGTNDAEGHAASDATGGATAETATPQQLEGLARDFVDGLRASGETGGLAAFPPPGTNPIKSGIVVPETFEIPPGYIRHYQTTDDGRRLEAILMYSPDYEFVDEKGEPITLPEDGIVPPEQAPPGLPVRMLEVPAAGTARVDTTTRARVDATTRTR